MLSMCRHNTLGMCRLLHVTVSVFVLLRSSSPLSQNVSVLPSSDKHNKQCERLTLSSGLRMDASTCTCHIVLKFLFLFKDKVSNVCINVCSRRRHVAAVISFTYLTIINIQRTSLTETSCIISKATGNLLEISIV